MNELRKSWVTTPSLIANDYHCRRLPSSKSDHIQRFNHQNLIISLFDCNFIRSSLLTRTVPSTKCWLFFMCVVCVRYALHFILCVQRTTIFHHPKKFLFHNWIAFSCRMFIFVTLLGIGRYIFFFRRILWCLLHNTERMLKLCFFSAPLRFSFRLKLKPLAFFRHKESTFNIQLNRIESFVCFDYNHVVPPDFMLIQ